MSHHKLCYCVLISCNHFSFIFKNPEFLRVWCSENRKEIPEEKVVNIAFTNEVTYAIAKVGLVQRKKQNT